VEERQQEPEQQQSNSTRQCELANSPCPRQCQIDNLEQTSIGNVSQVNFDDEPILLLTTSAIIVPDNQNDIDDPEPKHYMSLPNQKIQFDESSLGPIDQQIVVDEIEPHEEIETCQAKKPNLSRNFRSLKSSTNKYMLQKSKSKSMPDKLPLNQEKTHQTNWQINSTLLAPQPHSTTIESNPRDPCVLSPVLDDLIARLDDTPLAISWQTASSNTQSGSASSTDSLSDQTNEHQTHAEQAHTSTTSADARFELKPKQKCNSYTVLFDDGLSYDKNDPTMACQNTSRAYRSNGDREFFEDIGKGL
jgi:hypothetical protein